MRHHPGQISFPGGKAEKEDQSPEMTAIREAQEEVGIDPSLVEILGKLSELYVEVSRFSIQPILAWADQKPSFLINTEEVERLILFPLTTFAESETIFETELNTVRGLLRVKYYPFDNEIIWGATAMVLSELIEIVKKHKKVASQ
jgi:8-oxo-dGTP pyrophosphatase MutT (NUDIX family)